MDFSLNIDKVAFDKFLLKEQSKLEKEELLSTKLKYQSCMNLKNAFETSINDIITNNKRKSKIRFEQHNSVNFEDCAFDKDVKELKNIVSKSNLMLEISIEHLVPYPPSLEFENELKIILKPKMILNNYKS